MNTTEKNKLLAEFMDIDTSLKEIDCKDCRFFYQCNLIQCSLSDDELYKSPELFYNSDWNLLMEVVEKVLQICAEIDEMERYWCITDAIPYIDDVYNACVEFVNWYNEQNK